MSKQAFLAQPNTFPCPSCRKPIKKVIDSRPTNGYVYRRRKCACGFRLTTAEIPQETLEKLFAIQERFERLTESVKECYATATESEVRK